MNFENYFEATGFFSGKRRLQLQVNIDSGLYVMQYDREYCLDDSELIRKVNADICEIIAEYRGDV
ncbi:MAG: hypothetical protein IJG32_07170 [Selenomonadaceae bacterium]|nr:hypothetical protein [Selenomonadaceae bacterium]